MKRFIIPAAVLMIAASCNNKPTVNAPDPLVMHIDSTQDPSENFFYYANGRWFKENPIPSSQSSNGIFRTIQDTVNSQVRRICEQSAAKTDAKKGSPEQMIGDLFYSGLDTVNIEKQGINDLKPALDQIKNINNTQSLMSTVAYLHQIGCDPMFYFRVGTDDKQSSRNAIFMYQGGLGLPDRDYFFNTDERTVKIRTEYVKHINKMMELSGLDASGKSGNIILNIESGFAKASRKLEDTRDPYKNYNKSSVSDLQKKYSNTEIAAFIDNMGLKNADSVIIGQPEFFEALNTSIKKTSLEDWKLYLQWNLLNNHASYLNKSIESQNFNFYGTIMSGRTTMKPRWERIVEVTDRSLGEMIGKIYVKEYLPKGTKEKLLEIGNNIRDVYADHIKKLDWMSEGTKEKALSKLKKVNMKVGYPDKWKDMSGLEIDRSSYLKNIMNVHAWEVRDMLNKYGKPVDKDEWFMYPQTYNAYYDPTMNEIVVPACNIIVPGFEGRMPDDAVLYGIIGGSTFGHEITHGFDDQGSQYDENGNLRDWWTKEDREKFTAKTKQTVAQYNAYTVLDNKMNVNGEATQGENIADLGGLVMGYEAFKKTKQGKSDEMIGGLTPDQRFFLAYGYAWMVNRTDENIAQQIMSDVHSPSEFRVNGVVSNMPEFYKAFNIKEGSKMWRSDSTRVVIW